MEMMEPAPGMAVDALLLHGCTREAERGDIVSLELDGLRNALPETFHAHMRLVSDEIRTSSRTLRDIVHQAQVNFDRVPMVLNYLNDVLACLCRSLRDITSFYEDRSISREVRWRKMYHTMTTEAGGLPLPQRFMMYNDYLAQLVQMLTRSYNFDLNRLELLRERILQLREMRGIPPPTALVDPPKIQPDIFIHDPLQHIHWAELIFTMPLTSRTALKPPKPSKCVGPNIPWSYFNSEESSKILFRRPFEDEQVSVTVFTTGTSQSPTMLIRTFHAGQPWFAKRGVHELSIVRDNSALLLKRWSRSERCAKLWAAFSFQTWEEMVLFYCTFLSLKVRNPLTAQMTPEEYRLSGERRLFQAQIIDDGFKHSLIVYEDVATKALRLHAAVLEGDLKHCPVWTAFITKQAVTPGWLSRKGKSKHRVWLNDVQLYVFCQKYRQQNQRQNVAGAFEIYFVSREAPQRFQEVFFPVEPPPAEV